MSLPRNLPRGQQASSGISGGNKRPSRDERQDNTDESTTTGVERWPAKPSSAVAASEDPRFSVVKIDAELVARPPGTRSHSTDVTGLRAHDRPNIEQRRHTDCSDPRTIATRWIPQINKYRRESSPLARVDCEVTVGSANRWMTFVKNPSPDPVPRVNPERKGSITERSSKKDEGPGKDSENSKWQPPRKFSPAKSEKGHLQRQDELDLGRDRSPSCVDAANDRANKLSQRMRDLYDFKTENEWPKRAGSSQRENAWISKSSSEEERTNYQPVRRNSQELEFNDRMMSGLKSKAERKDNRRWPKQGSGHDAGDVFADEQEERLRKFNDKLRYSEDLGSGRARGRERRTYSDDYDEKARRESRMSRQPESLAIKRPETPAKRVDKENKRNSDVSARSRESRVSYVEVDFSKRETRVSDASYASVNFSKRGSVECKSTRKILEAPPRRAFSDERPATPVPPIEWNDEHFVPKKLPSERQKRDSTRYKVYLT